VGIVLCLDHRRRAYWRVSHRKWHWVGWLGVWVDMWEETGNDRIGIAEMNEIPGWTLLFFAIGVC
jgi:hypothetical protein